MMTCKQISELLDEYRMNRLTPQEAAAVASHLADCSTCAEELETLQRLNEMLSAEPSEIPRSAYFISMREQLKQRIDAEEQATNLDQSPAASAKVLPVQDGIPKRYRWAEIAAAFLIGASAMLLLQSVEDRQAAHNETHNALSRKRELVHVNDETRPGLPPQEAEVGAKALSQKSSPSDSSAAPAAASPAATLRNEPALETAPPSAGNPLVVSESAITARAFSSERDVSASPPPASSAPNATIPFYNRDAPTKPGAITRSLAKSPPQSAAIDEDATATAATARINPMALLQEINQSADSYKPSPPVDISGALAAAQAAAPTPEPVHVWRSKTLSSAAPTTTAPTETLSTYLYAEDIASAGSTSEAIRKFTEAAASNPDSHLALRATLRIAELHEAAGDISQALEAYRRCLQPPLVSYASTALRDEIERRIARLVVR